MAKKLTKKIKAIIICATAVGVALIILFIAYVGLWTTEVKVWTPNYEKENLAQILSKPELDDADYEKIYRQTGLTKAGTDRLLARGIAGKNKIYSIQNNFFEEREIIKSRSFLFCEEFTDKDVPYVYLENGDILISTTAHVSFYRMGHAAIVINSASGTILQAASYNDGSFTATASSFTTRPNFMIFTPKTDKETKENAARFAYENLLDVRYGLAASIFGDKEDIKRTQCAHLVWAAYKKFGLDLDGDGGKLVTPNDLANSPNMELLQVFGMDLDKLWK